MRSISESAHKARTDTDEGVDALHANVDRKWLTRTRSHSVGFNSKTDLNRHRVGGPRTAKFTRDCCHGRRPRSTESVARQNAPDRVRVQGFIATLRRVLVMVS